MSAPKISVTLTGTGIPVPAPGRAGAGALVSVGDLHLQFDAGRATVLRLAERGVATSDLAALFLTHHHSDHCVDVGDVVFSRWIHRAPALPVVFPDGPLTVFGDELLELWREDLGIRERVTGRAPLTMEWTPFAASDEIRTVWSEGDVVVDAVLVDHPPVAPAVAYRVRAGGRSVVISGDTRVCDAVEELSRGADVLVHEAALREAMAPGADQSVYAYHADPTEIGRMAQRAGVATVLLTHLLPAPATPEAEERFAAAVRRGGFTGELHVGRDLLTVDVPGGEQR